MAQSNPLLEPSPVTPYSHSHVQHLLSSFHFDHHPIDEIPTHLLIRHRLALSDGMMGINGMKAAAECLQIASQMDKVGEERTGQDAEPGGTMSKHMGDNIIHGH